MSYIGAVPQSDIVIMAWRSCAQALTIRNLSAAQKSARRRSGDSMAAGDSETKILWRQASTTELLIALRGAASEMMQRAINGMAALLQMSHDAAELWTEHWVPSSPHQELIPWCAWFREIAARRPAWEVLYPDEEYLHP